MMTDEKVPTKYTKHGEFLKKLIKRTWYCPACNLLQDSWKRECLMCGHALEPKAMIELPCPLCLCGAPLRYNENSENWYCEEEHGEFADFDGLIELIKQRPELWER